MTAVYVPKDVNVADSDWPIQTGRFRRSEPRGSRAPLGFSVDSATGFRPAVEADREMGDVGEPHLAEHVRGERGALAACAVHDDALGRVDLAGVVVRGRVEPELEHPARH